MKKYKIICKDPVIKIDSDVEIKNVDHFLNAVIIGLSIWIIGVWIAFIEVRSKYRWNDGN